MKQKILKKITLAGMAFMLLFSFLVVLRPGYVYAAPSGGPAQPCTLSNGQCASCYGDKCIDCSKTACEDSAVKCSQGNCDLINTYVNPAIKVLSILVGIVVVMSLILGGIQYSASEGDPQKAAKARDRIAKTIMALLVYIFLYAFLQFLIPGGAFNRH